MSFKTICSGIVVEDIEETRQWMGAVLCEVFPGIDLAFATTCAEGLALLRGPAVDIAIIDLGLPDGSGVDLIAQARVLQPDCLCVVSTMFDDDEHIFAALQASACGYVLKDQSRHEIRQLLEGICNGVPPLSPAIARHLLDYFRQPVAAARANPLTPKETEILQLIAKGYTVAKTAELSGITYNTAAGYVKVIYRKLNISSRAEAVMEASQLGIL